MLITNAEIFGSTESTPTDLRVVGDRIEQIGQLPPHPNEEVVDAAGGALLPGLHDHHIHLLSYAASLGSVHCGPPTVHDEAELVHTLKRQPGTDWLRGYGYHESVAGEIDRHWLDQQLPERPVRIQHRSGRLWILNSSALAQLAANQQQSELPGLDLPEDGRLYDADARLGALLGRTLPPVAEASRQLASFGVIGITDMTPGNDAESLALFTELRASGALLQHVYLAGALELPFPSLPDPVQAGSVTTGPTKIHLHDSALPEFDALCTTIADSHSNGRPIAVHCVTEVELVYTLAAIEEAGTLSGDRIEHASVTPPDALESLAKLGLTVVTQPNFIAERGDAYLQDLPQPEHDWLYRASAFENSGVALAGGTDAPFGRADPWVAIRAAVTRQTANGGQLGPAEALTPERAVGLFSGCAESPAAVRQIEAGTVANLCLLNRPWAEARTELSSDLVRATFISGKRAF